MTQKTHKVQIAATLRDAREHSDLSMIDAAEKLEVAKATPSRIETGAIAVTADRIAQMAALYGLSVPDLMQGHIAGMPRQADLDALRDVVRFIQGIILELDARPSAD